MRFLTVFIVFIILLGYVSLADAHSDVKEEKNDNLEKRNDEEHNEPVVEEGFNLVEFVKEVVTETMLYFEEHHSG